MKSRKERRAEARANKVAFEPQYKSGTRTTLKGEVITVGGAPRTYQEVFGKKEEAVEVEVVETEAVETTE